jgi:5-methylcytosine-specific restriction endonuclease McrA
VNAKKLIRKKFRDAVFERDGSSCRVCRRGKIGSLLASEQLDAHHITDRHKMPHGGYVVENGISLCQGCHVKAEVFHLTGMALPGFSPDELYKLVGSSYAQAVFASSNFKQ